VTKSPKSPSAPGKNDSAKDNLRKPEQGRLEPNRPEPGKAVSGAPSSDARLSDAPASVPASRPASATPAVKRQDALSDTKARDSKQEPAKADAAKTEPAKQAARQEAPESAPAPARSVPAASTPAAPTAQPSSSVKRPIERSGAHQSQAARHAETRSQAGNATSIPALIAAGLVGGLIAGAGFIAYDLLMRSAPADQTARIAAIEQRVEGLAQRETVTPDALGDVDSRLAAVEAQAGEALATAQEAAGRAIPEVPADAIQANTEAVAALQAEALANAQAITSLRNEIEAIAPRIDAVAADISAVQQAFTPAWRDAASQLGAANRLASAIAEGRPYVETYQALSALGVSSEYLAAIEPFAQQGAPGPSELVNALRGAVGEARTEQAAAAPPPPDVGGGFFQRLAERAITVETVDAPPAPRPQLAPGVEAALIAGDFEAALAGWEQQPEAVRSVTQDWAQVLRQRIGAARAADAIGNEAIAALAAR
jgi:hypothetical protein